MKNTKFNSEYIEVHIPIGQYKKYKMFIKKILSFFILSKVWKNSYKQLSSITIVLFGQAKVDYSPKVDGKSDC